MTPEERQMLSSLADKIAQTPAPAIDREAEQLIRSRIGSRPDALYLMTQTVLIQNLALEQAQEQIRQLQAQGAANQTSQGNFLPSQPGQGYAAPAAQPQAAPQGGRWSGGESGGFLRGAAQTAAGVAAGALAFDGIRSLFGGLGHMGGYGGSGFFGGAPTEETIVNNYYDSSNDAFTQGTNEHGSSFLNSGDTDDTAGSDTDLADTSDFGDTYDTSSDDFGDDSSFDGGDDFLA